MKFEKTNGKRLGTSYLLVSIILIPFSIFILSSHLFAALVGMVALYGILLIRANPTWSISIEEKKLLIQDWRKVEEIELEKIIRLELIDFGDDAGLRGLKIDGGNHIIELPCQLNNFSTDLVDALRKIDPTIRLDRTEEKFPPEPTKTIRKTLNHLKQLALTSQSTQRR